MTRTRQILGWTAVLALVIWAGFYAYGRREELGQAFHLQPALLAAMAALFAGCLAVRGLIIRVAVSVFAIELRPPEWFSITIVNTAAGLALPFGGVAVRAVYLKERHGLSFQDFAVILAACSILLETVHCVVGLGAWTFVATAGSGDGGAGFRIVGALLAGVALAGLAFLAYTPAVGTREPGGAWSRRLEGILSGWRRLRANRRVFFALGALTFADVAALGAMKWVTFRAIGSPLGVPEALVLNAIGGLALAVRITPGGLGIQEGLQGASGAALGLDPAVATVAALAERAVTTLFVLVASPFALRVLLAGKAPRPVEAPPEGTRDAGRSGPVS